MALQDPGLDIGYVIAAADYSTVGQFKAVKVATTAALTVTLANTGGESILGILQNNPTTAAAADVRFTGISKGLINGTVTAGDKLMTDTTAAFITATTTNIAVAVALESGVPSTLITVALIPGIGQKQ